MANVAGRADEIIFVDLCAGSGLLSYGHQKEIFPGAGFTALASGLPITKYILCESNPEEAKALQFRLDKYFVKKYVIVVNEDPATRIAKLMEMIPQSKAGRKVAVLCLVDPSSIEIPFTEIDKLSSIGWSFLMPFTLPLNTRIDFRYYLEEYAFKLQHYLGPAADSLSDASSNWQFYQRMVRVYENNMLVLGMSTALSVHKFSSQWMEVPAYYMGFFSKRLSAKAIQHEVQSLDQPQFALF